MDERQNAKTVGVKIKVTKETGRAKAGTGKNQINGQLPKTNGSEQGIPGKEQNKEAIQQAVGKVNLKAKEKEKEKVVPLATIGTMSAMIQHRLTGCAKSMEWKKSKVQMEK